ncbi:hypothetical protein CHLRE_14g618500v5 [Chlamydomonas reinhardtii]|uniref:BACK domain-containing protein n=1 Tax=Chlamydomonas reinhardtii TaxID=3055 RepID=A0A2K3CXS0_CHLRE|nr:uncharacterized protein CHLRE_14g618500v5 [Chlamydomonas reinhardtii]PNW73087.1 hypothetical protein CHLRE_14g618500v5 [Chlamydomonas reinhardtii]
MAPPQPGPSSTAPINSKVAAAISGLFNRSEGADCQLVFVLDPSQPTGKSGNGAVTQGAGTQSKAAQKTLGEPLPAHSFVLRYASDKIAAQLKWLETEGANATVAATRAPPSKKARISRAAASAATAAAALTPPEKQLPEVQLMLGGEEELPAARAAIKFAYTGHVEAGGGIHELLMLRQQAAYLQMEGCVEACAEALKQQLAESGGAAAAGASTSAGSGNAAASRAGAAAPAVPVLELYSCTQLWPDPAGDAAFAAMLTHAKRRLVAHFRDALAVLNNKERFEQMLELPAEGLEALLQSDDFGTDNESSVVLMLAEWMAVNYAASTNWALRQRLCGLLRLAQCSRAYLSCVLPVLAARHQHSPTNAAGWFPITPAAATCLLTYSLVPEPERQGMIGAGMQWGPCGGLRCIPPGWLSTQTRRQCLPAEGRTFKFIVGLPELEQSFAGLTAGQPGAAGSCIADSPPANRIAAQGLEWKPAVEWVGGDTAAGLFIGVRLPVALRAAVCDDSTAAAGVVAMAEELMYKAIVAYPPARWSVCRACGEVAWSGALPDKSFVPMGESFGWPDVFELDSEAAAGKGARGGGPRSKGNFSAVAARWAGYLQGGKHLEGRVTLLPPPSK